MIKDAPFIDERLLGFKVPNLTLKQVVDMATQEEIDDAVYTYAEPRRLIYSYRIDLEIKSYPTVLEGLEAVLEKARSKVSEGFELTLLGGEELYCEQTKKKSTLEGIPALHILWEDQIRGHLAYQKDLKDYLRLQEKLKL